MKKIYYLIILFIIVLSGCNDEFLDRYPQTSLSKENFFNSEADLDMYIYSLYDFPDMRYNDDGYDISDNAVSTVGAEVKLMMDGNASSTNITAGWSWGTLRNINYFLENFGNADLSQDKLDHFEGLARFFRARFYMDKVKRFSDVPWYDQVIETADEELLYKSRDSRDLVVEKIFEDYEFARQHVEEDGEDGEVTRFAVAAYELRHALYEGTWRKYHPELGLESTANEYLELAVEIAEDIMENGGFRIYKKSNPMEDYGSIFIHEDLTRVSEVILANIHEYEIVSSGHRETMFGEFEVAPARDLLQSYLMSDGSYYSQQGVDIDTLQFVDEFKERDPRLYQTYAWPGWELHRASSVATGAGIYVQRIDGKFPGYHQIKGLVNTIDVPTIASVDFIVLRFAEVLLNYAEAKAELGTLTQEDLDISVNLLRKRAGMPDMTLNPAVDQWQQAKYPDIASSNILEIRRERRVELALEGFRHDDMMRWGVGENMEQEQLGMYFPALGRYDLTGDGFDDIKLIGASENIPPASKKDTNQLGVKLIYYRAGPEGSSANVILENGESGRIVTVGQLGTFVEPKYYYRPVPEGDVLVNPNLLPQLFGWE